MIVDNAGPFQYAATVEDCEGETWDMTLEAYSWVDAQVIARKSCRQENYLLKGVRFVDT